jgi:hypothetical protein
MKLSAREKAIRKERDLRRIRVAAQYALKHGALPQITYEKAEEFFENGIYDSIIALKTINVKNVRWHLHNKVEIDDPIWNADFISGITQSGKILWGKVGFATFTWYGIPILVDIFEDSPFYGVVQKNPSSLSGKHPYSWRGSPALYLKPSKKTVSYVAGVLSAGKVSEHKGKKYIAYKPSCKACLEDFGIPIERETCSSLFISPFWPALLTIHMPECCRDYFLKIKKAYRGEEYAAIMWATHASHYIIKGGLPFLPSRRTVFYRYKSAEGTLKTLQRKRIEYDLLGLDKRIKGCIASWIVNS